MGEARGAKQGAGRDAISAGKTAGGAEGRMNCQKCAYYFVTWDPSFPRGCRLYGFKSVLQPSAAVYDATGARCQNYDEKTKNRRA